MGSGGEVVKRAECGCCGMWEECTTGYIGRVQEPFGGDWGCGLREEAIKDEQARLGISTQAALRFHATFLDAKTVAPPAHIVHSLVQLIRKIMSSCSSSSWSLNYAPLPRLSV